MIFHWAARAIDAWLALWRPINGWSGRPARLRDWWRTFPGDLMGFMIMRLSGIPEPTREVDAGDVKAVLVEDRRIARYFRLHLMPVRAQTVGRYVFAREAVPDDILAHEMEHIRQWERFGPFYLPLYFCSSALAFVRGKRAYWDNAFEAAARQREDQYRRESADRPKS